ncbi:MAG: sodium-dependent transporter [Ruminococcaceae bacterium]|nr:sodium-dependent transporter [Oscillospiraceae bacterium]
MNNQREKLSSRLGFILLSAGCAIGLGNVWKFPWLVGQNGGAFFVLIYLVFLIAMGVPIMTMEFAVGRAAQRSPARMYHAVTPQKKGWRVHGYASLIGIIMLMMFYTMVAGWMLYYFVETVNGCFIGLENAAVGEKFGAFTGDWLSMTFYMVVVTVLCFAILSLGVQKGLEKVTKYMMLALLAIMIFLAVYTISLEGGIEGLKFYLVPNVDSFMKDPLTVITNAMNQSFFTLSIGIGSMAIFGSYIGKDRALMGEAVNVAVLDTFVAITAGLIIFPACFALNNGNVDAGPPLIFITLSNVFAQMGPILGRIVGGFFFLFLSFAALSTVLAVFEAIVACIMEMTGWSRKKTCFIGCIGMCVLALPAILGFNVLSGINLMGVPGKNIMDFEDFIVSNCLLPLGSLVFVLYCTWSKHGWGWKKFTEEANTGKGLKVPSWLYYYCKFALPVIILFLFGFGIFSIYKEPIMALFA